ncbi:DUF4276 family protein [bacterium]|nr:DUF4276 family protein [bacterium]
MHLEILVEGQSDRTALEPILVKILGPYREPHTWRIFKHQGIGELPDDSNRKPDRKNRTLLHNLPASIRAYGMSLDADSAVVVLVDLDTKNCKILKNCLMEILNLCDPKPECLIRIAIEELEAWFLGDEQAFLRAYPKAKSNLIESYEQDSICGTWELLADAVYPGGLKAMQRKGRPFCLAQKRVWAKDIAPEMNVEANVSKSF